MRPEVRAQFPAFTTRYEGRIPWMYADVKQLVTIGCGNLIDPVGLALGLPFVHADGSTATQAEINAEWHRVKNALELARLGAGAAKKYCRLHLTDIAINGLLLARLDMNEAILAKTFPAWESWPAEAQLGVLSMAWAMGAGFTKKWPTFTRAALDERWAECADNCKIREDGNPGIVPRNVANKKLFMAAASSQTAASSQVMSTVGITDGDRANVERLHALWFDGQVHAEDFSGERPS